MSRIVKLAVALALVATPVLAKERLVLEPYPADQPWQEVTNKSLGDKFLREYIPADQDVAAYRDIMSAQSFPEARQADPADFLRGISKQVGRACKGLRVNGPTERKEDGFPVAYMQVYCGQQVGQPHGVNMFFKAIGGGDALYVVQREMRTPPSPVGGVQTFSGEAAKAMLELMKRQSTADAYLTDQVYLCPEASTREGCQAPH